MSPLSDDEPRPGEPHGSPESSGGADEASLGGPDQDTHRRRKRTPRDETVALGQFELLEVLGTGDMGQVYRAVDTETDCVIAVKSLRQLTPSRRRALERGFDELCQLSHPGLVQFYELFITDGDAHFSQELVSGTTLDEYVFGADIGRRDFGEGAVARLIDASRQICEGLELLHSRRLVHHNLKPSNLVIADGGRVVLLDGGLLPENELWDLQPFDQLLHSGIAYAAPERFVRGSAAGTAADLFSLGAMLHEFVTGTRAALPEDPALRATPPPDQLPRHLPQELRDLIATLLLVDPSRRPSAAKARAMLSRLCAPKPSNPLPIIRREDYAKLEAAYGWARSKRARVSVRGALGAGTTTLVASFCSALSQRGVTVLQGRCQRGDTRPYAAVAQLLPSLLAETDLQRVAHSGEVGALRMHAVALLFPDAAWPHVDELPASSQLLPRDARQHAFDSFAKLLARVLGGHHAVLWLDEAQFADADSLALLAALEAYPGLGDLVVLLSYSGQRALAEQPLHGVRRDGEATVGDESAALGREIELLPLTAAELDRYRGYLAAQTSAGDGPLERMSGTMWQLAELARGGNVGHAQGSKLDALITRRGVSLPRGSRRLLALLAIAGYPLPARVVLPAAGLAHGGLAVLGVLVAIGLVRRRTHQGAATFELSHGEVHDAVMDSLTAEQLTDLHQRLALQLLPDDPRRAIHLLAAGALDEGFRGALDAAHDATLRFAFNRAAQHYQLLSDRVPSRADARLHELLASALGAAGRTFRAAEQFARAADLASTSAERTRLRVLSAQAYLRAGSAPRGMEVLETVFAQAGLTLPVSSGATSGGSRGLWRRAMGAWAQPRKTPRVDPFVLDGLWEAVAHTATQANGASAAWARLHGDCARTSADPAHTLRALGYQVIEHAESANQRELDVYSEQLESVVTLAQHAGQRSANAWSLLTRAEALLLRGEWQPALKHAARARRLFALHLDAGSWEVTRADTCLLSAAALCGELTTLEERLPPLLTEALGRQEVTRAETLGLGHPALLWLCHDRAEYALDLVRRAEARQFEPVADRLRYERCLTLVPALLYLGQPARALERLDTELVALQRAPRLQNGLARVDLLQLEARAALALAASSTGPVRDALLERVARTLPLLEAVAISASQPYAALLRAGVATLQADTAKRTEALERAAAGFDLAQMALYAAIARHALGSDAPGHEPALAAFDVRDIQHLFRSLAPAVSRP